MPRFSRASSPESTRIFRWCDTVGCPNCNGPVRSQTQVPSFGPFFTIDNKRNRFGSATAFKTWERYAARPARHQPAPYCGDRTGDPVGKHGNHFRHQRQSTAASIGRLPLTDRRLPCSELLREPDPAVDASQQLGSLIDPEFHSCGTGGTHGSFYICQAAIDDKSAASRML